jgi:hypothetical protein
MANTVLMTSLDIMRQRLFNQHLAGVPFEKPEDVVRWLGAVQAQEYAGAKWAVAQRTKGIRDAAIDQAFAEGTILRTHVMRPTWHFVTPADIRWMLKLTAPRVNAVNAYYYRKFELDDAIFRRSNAVLAKALQGGKQLTRPELASLLQQAGIPPVIDDRLRLSYIMMRAELDGLICSGALRGKQHTYALLEERIPQAKTLERDEALAELTKRYFMSHGPATLKDYLGWSGLTAVDAKAGLEMVKSQLAQEVVDDKTYWFAPNVPTTQEVSPIAHLLPAYDEYTIAYKDHSTILDPQHLQQVISDNGIVIVIDGHIVGTWKRIFKGGTVIITPSLFTPLGQAENHAVAEAAQRYGAFLDMTVTLG